MCMWNGVEVAVVGVEGRRRVCMLVGDWGGWWMNRGVCLSRQVVICV